MDWKEFFKPNKKKIIVFLILSFLPIPFYVKSYCKCYPAGCKCPEVLVILLLILIIPILLGAKFFLIGVIVGSLLNYLLSCLMSWIYDKVRKR